MGKNLASSMKSTKNSNQNGFRQLEQSARIQPFSWDCIWPLDMESPLYCCKQWRYKKPAVATLR